MPGDLLQLGPESQVAISRKHMTSKLNQVCGTRELAAYVLEAMHALPEEQIGRRENGHATAPNAELRRAIHKRPRWRRAILNV